MKISVERPCHEKWNSFSPTPDGGFCHACSQVVIDFTTMSDKDLIAYLSSKKEKTCGRFRPDQLKNYPNRPQKVAKSSFWTKVAFASAILFAAVPTANAQRSRSVSVQVVESHPLASPSKVIASTPQVIQGLVTSKEDGLPLPGVNIVLKGTAIGTISNENGHFTFPQPLQDGDILEFSFIGLVTSEYKVKTQVGEQVAIRIELTLQMEMDITGKVQVDDIYEPHLTWKDRVRSWFNKM